MQWKPIDGSWRPPAWSWVVRPRTKEPTTTTWHSSHDGGRMKRTGGWAKVGCSASAPAPISGARGHDPRGLRARALLTARSKTTIFAVMARPREFDAEEALGQVMRVFWDQGYQASTFADLTKAADVRKQSLYGVFGNKRSLFLKSLALYRNQVLS